MTSNVRLLPPLAANIAVGRARRASGRGITATIPQREGQFLCPVTKARPSRGTFCFAAEGAQGAGVETSPDADQTTFTILARNCRGVLQVCLFVDSTRQRRPTRYFSLLNENARQTRFTSFPPRFDSWSDISYQASNLLYPFQTSPSFLRTLLAHAGNLFGRRGRRVQHQYDQRCDRPGRRHA